MSEPEDFEAIEAARQVAELACGWNGSLELWVPSAGQGDPMPDGVRERLAAARERSAKRAQAQRAQGLCL